MSKLQNKLVSGNSTDYLQFKYNGRYLEMEMDFDTNASTDSTKQEILLNAFSFSFFKKLVTEMMIGYLPKITDQVDMSHSQNLWQLVLSSCLITKVRHHRHIC